MNEQQANLLIGYAARIAAALEHQARIPSDADAQLLTPAQVAELCQVAEGTVLDWLANPEHPLRGVKLGNRWRVRRSVLDAWLDRPERPAGTVHQLVGRGMIGPQLRKGVR